MYREIHLWRQWCCAVLASPLSHLLDGDKHKNGTRFVETMANSVQSFGFFFRFLFLLFYVMRSCACPIGKIRPQLMHEWTWDLARTTVCSSKPKISTQIKQPPSDNRSNDPSAGENEQNVWRTVGTKKARQSQCGNEWNGARRQPRRRKWKKKKRKTIPNERRWRKT